MSQQARWRYTGPEWNKVGVLATSLRDGTIISARTEHCVMGPAIFGWWEVRENMSLVSFGQISQDEEHWRDGHGLRLEAERVICLGATEIDRLHADAEIIRRAQRSMRRSNE